ncbi:MAG: hypothetical protein ABI045_06950 [Flavobacteriales bacterium]
MKESENPRLAASRGFLDTFGDGGWRPLISGTLISNERTSKYVIG